MLSIAIKKCKYCRYFFWGFGFVIVNAFYVFNLEEINPRNWLLLVLVSLWGLRLTIYLAIRNIGKGEDYRYQQFRKDLWSTSVLVVFLIFKFFLLQGGLILLVFLTLFRRSFKCFFWGFNLARLYCNFSLDYWFFALKRVEIINCIGLRKTQNNKGKSF